MTLKNSKEIIDTVRAFPQGKNVRIKIEGLAVFDIDPNTDNASTVDFLQFVRHHELRLTIVKVASNGTTSYILRNHPIPPSTRAISVSPSDSVHPNSYLHDTTTTANGELPLLERTLHLSNLHNVRFSRRVSGPETTTLSMHHVSFCTNEVTLCKYRVRLDGAPIFDPIELTR